jgi:hypothetical protein
MLTRCLVLGALVAWLTVCAPTSVMAGESCRSDQIGLLHADPYTAVLTQCIEGPGGNASWEVPQPGVTPPPGNTPLAANALATAIKGVAGGVGSALVTSGARSLGACTSPGRVMLSPVDGTRVTCGDDGVWAPDVVSRSSSSSRLVGTASPIPQPAPLVDPLDPDLGNPTGLPPGVSLPPGTTMLAGSPARLASKDYFKHAEWMIQATVASTDIEAISEHFARQCLAIGWLYDPKTVERFPDQNPPNRSYDRSVPMIAGQCRTAAGAEEERWAVRPWFVAWSVALRPGATSAELVVELRSNTRLGGRP